MDAVSTLLKCLKSKRFINDIEKAKAEVSTERIKLRIPLIIVPNPATSSPPTRISRKSAIQAHCLHAK